MINHDWNETFFSKKIKTKFEASTLQSKCGCYDEEKHLAGHASTFCE